MHKETTKEHNTQDHSKDSEWMCVRSSGIHHRGVFAVKDIPKGLKVVEYTGEKVSKQEGTARLAKQAKEGMVYIFELDDQTDIDGLSGGSDAIYINHSCEPNCVIDIADGKIWVIAIRDIKSGEELSYDYCFDFDEETFNIPCKCGSKDCRGYIVSEDDYLKMKECLSAKERSAAKSIPCSAAASITMLYK
jgi:SET domain-containing protein